MPLRSFARVSFGSQNPNETACEDLSLVHVFHFLHDLYPPFPAVYNKVPVKIEEFNSELISDKENGTTLLTFSIIKGGASLPLSLFIY